MSEVIFLVLGLLIGIWLEQIIGFKKYDDLDDDDLDNL